MGEIIPIGMVHVFIQYYVYAAKFSFMIEIHVRLSL